MRAFTWEPPMSSTRIRRGALRGFADIGDPLEGEPALNAGGAHEHAAAGDPVPRRVLEVPARPAVSAGGGSKLISPFRSESDARGGPTQPRGSRTAFGAPGTEPRWTHSNKDGVGTAYSGDSTLWFTLWRGILTEAYYPTIDRPQLRDLELLFTDGESFVHEEKRDLVPIVERLEPYALGYRVRSHPPSGGYSA